MLKEFVDEFSSDEMSGADAQGGQPPIPGDENPRDGLVEEIPGHLETITSRMIRGGKMKPFPPMDEEDGGRNAQVSSLLQAAMEAAPPLQDAAQTNGHMAPPPTSKCGTVLEMTSTHVRRRADNKHKKRASGASVEVVHPSGKRVPVKSASLRGMYYPYAMRRWKANLQKTGIVDKVPTARVVTKSKDTTVTVFEMNTVFLNLHWKDLAHAFEANEGPLSIGEYVRSHNDEQPSQRCIIPCVAITKKMVEVLGGLTSWERIFSALLRDFGRSHLDLFSYMCLRRMHVTYGPVGQEFRPAIPTSVVNTFAFRVGTTSVEVEEPPPIPAEATLYAWTKRAPDSLPAYALDFVNDPQSFYTEEAAARQAAEAVHRGTMRDVQNNPVGEASEEGGDEIGMLMPLWFAPAIAYYARANQTGAAEAAASAVHGAISTLWRSAFADENKDTLLVTQSFVMRAHTHLSRVVDGRFLEAAARQRILARAYQEKSDAAAAFLEERVTEGLADPEMERMAKRLRTPPDLLKEWKQADRGGCQ